jgi:uncharacterized protein
MASPFPTAKSLIDGEAGAIEIAAHVPTDVSPRAVAVVAHPHPLFGGSMDNKVVTTIARAFFEAGAAVYRFNFRGVGKTGGTHDDGKGESRDMQRVIAHARAQHPDLALWLAGFSFGGAVACVASEAAEIGRVDEMALVAPAFHRLADWADFTTGGHAPASTLLIHGELDDTVPLTDSFDWAREREIAVVVVPGAEHFFHQRLHILKRLILQHLGVTNAEPDASA